MKYPERNILKDPISSNQSMYSPQDQSIEEHLKNKEEKNSKLIFNWKHKNFNLQATRSAADDKIGILMAGIFLFAKRSKPPLTPRPAKI